MSVCSLVARLDIMLKPNESAGWPAEQWEYRINEYYGALAPQCSQSRAVLSCGGPTRMLKKSECLEHKSSGFHPLKHPQVRPTTRSGHQQRGGMQQWQLGLTERRPGGPGFCEPGSWGRGLHEWRRCRKSICAWGWGLHQRRGCRKAICTFLPWHRSSKSIVPLQRGRRTESIMPPAGNGRWHRVSVPFCLFPNTTDRVHMQIPAVLPVLACPTCLPVRAYNSRPAPLSTP